MAARNIRTTLLLVSVTLLAGLIAGVDRKPINTTEEFQTALFEAGKSFSVESCPLAFPNCYRALRQAKPNDRDHCSRPTSPPNTPEGHYPSGKHSY